MVGDALRVIAGRHGDDAATALLGRQRRQAIEGAALLVGGGKLQVLELEPNLAAVLGTDNVRLGSQGVVMTAPLITVAARSTSASVTSGCPWRVSCIPVS